MIAEKNTDFIIISQYKFHFLTYIFKLGPVYARYARFQRAGFGYGLMSEARTLEDSAGEFRMGLLAFRSGGIDIDVQSAPVGA